MSEKSVAVSSHKKIEDIHGVKVTGRGAELVLEFLDLTEKDIMQLPQDAVVLEVGSAWMQELGVKLKSLRPDIQMVSLDPTLGIAAKKQLKPLKYLAKYQDAPNDEGYHSGNTLIEPLNKDRPEIGGTYLFGLRHQDFPGVLSKEEFEVMQTKRQQHATEYGGVAAFAPELPFAPNSMNLIVDTFGAGLYLSDEVFPVYITNAVKILKPGGELRIFALEGTDILRGEVQLTDSVRNDHARKRVAKAVEGLNVEVTFFEKVDKATNNRNRVGVVIKKVE